MPFAKMGEHRKRKTKDIRMRDPNPKSDKGEQDGGEGRLQRDSYVPDQVGGGEKVQGGQPGQKPPGQEAFSR